MINIKLVYCTMREVHLFSRQLRGLDQSFGLPG
jgi:hypothetical protein